MEKGDLQAQPIVGSVWGNWSVNVYGEQPCNGKNQHQQEKRAEEMLDKLVERYLSIMDANDMIYAFESSRFYNPAHILQKKKCLC
jgi:homoserine O-acetyltransferase